MNGRIYKVIGSGFWMCYPIRIITRSEVIPAVYCFHKGGDWYVELGGWELLLGSEAVAYFDVERW